ncbi:MAG: putative phosphoesterase [Labilithrix sp.]|nr:putative phosphoesterase [Labilithrix sp.]
MAAPFAVAVALGTAVAVSSRVRAARRGGLAVTTHEVPWSADLGRRVRVVQLTDIHAGPTTPVRMLARVAEVVTSLEPDLVVLTGDYVNAYCVYVDRVTALVARLPGPVVATLGNHDHWTDPARVTRALERGGATVLANASTVVRGDGFALTVVGVDDGRSGHADVPRAFAGARAEGALVLTHYPNTADLIAETGARLVLAGHTHAGQVHVPHVTKLLARLAGHPYLHGFHRVRETDLYVSAGIGHSLTGLRAGRTRPEIAVFDLDPAATFRRSRTEHRALVEPPAVSSP